MKKIFSIIVCFMLCFMLFFSLKLEVFADTNRYVFGDVLFGNIDSSEQVIEDWRPSNEWFISNNTIFTTIRFVPFTESLNDYVDMFYENINNGTKIHACRFRTALGGQYAVPYYTSQNYEIIEVIGNLPYENYTLWENMFVPLESKTTFNVSIAEDYIFSFTKPNFDLSLNVVYHGVFKMEWNNEMRYFDQMMLVETNSGYAVALNFANSSQYAIGTAYATNTDEQTIIIERMYCYTSKDFPSYITIIPIDIENWSDFLYTIIDVPLYYLYSLTNFEIFGINVWLGIGSLVVVGFLVYLIKKVL